MSNSSATCRCWCSCSCGSSCCRNCCRESAGLWLKQMPNAPFWTAAIGVGLFMSARVADATARPASPRCRADKSMAATALGLTTAQAYRYVLLPMAFRIILPPLTSEFLNTIKNTSVAITIGLIELTGAGARDAGILVPGVRGLHRRDGAVSPVNFVVVTAHALPRALGGGPRLHHREVRRHVRQSRFRRHPPLAGLSLPRRHDVHADADRRCRRSAALSSAR